MFILGKKIEMTQVFDNKGNALPVTLIEAGPCFVTGLKTKEKDKYDAIQIGFGKLKDVKKSLKARPYRHVKEFKSDGTFNVGDKIDVSAFKEGDIIEVSGISKGKGFQGIIRRYKVASKPATHGVKHEERAMGSVGTSFPEHVIKGKKMPGRMGYERTTVKNLKIVKIDPEKNILAVFGAVPGKRGTLLEIRS